MINESETNTCIDQMEHWYSFAALGNMKFKPDLFVEKISAVINQEGSFCHDFTRKLDQ